MTEEQLRAAGWPEDDIPAMLKGCEKAEAILAAIPESKREPEAETATAAGETEVEARKLAERLMVQSEGEDAKVRARQAASRVVVVTDRPGGAPTVEQQRQWALRQAMEIAPPMLRPGTQDDNYTLVLDGEVIATQTAPPTLRLILPGQWDEFDRQEKQRVRDAENAMLIRAFGAERCQRAGIL